MKRFRSIFIVGLVLALSGLVGMNSAQASGRWVSETRIEPASNVSGPGWKAIPGTNMVKHTRWLLDYTGGNSACGGGYFCEWVDANYYGNRTYVNVFNYQDNSVNIGGCLDFRAWGMTDNALSSFNNQTQYYTIHTWDGYQCDNAVPQSDNWYWGRGPNPWVGSTYNDRASSQMLHYVG